MARYWRMTSILTWSGTLELSEAQLYEDGTPVAVTPTASVAPTSGSLGDLVDGLATASVVWSGAMPTLVWDTSGLTNPNLRLGAGTSEDVYPVDLILQSSDDAFYWTTHMVVNNLAYPGDWTLPALATDAPVDPHAASVVLALDGAMDVSVDPKTITLLGNASESYLYSQFGGAALFFDGAGDSVTVPTGTAFAFGTADFTVECWVRPSSVDGLTVIYDGRTGTIGSAAGMSLSISSGTLRCDTNVANVLSGGTLVVGTWYHTALTRDSGTFRLWLDGAQVSSSAAAYNLTDGNVTIGAYGGAQFFNGHIHELRLTQGVCRYTGGFTPESWLVSSPDPYFSNVSLLLLANGTHGSTAIADSSATNHPITPYGNASISTANSHSGGSSLYFDGTGDYMAIPTSEDFDLGEGDATIEFWFSTVQTAIYATFLTREWQGAPYTGGWEILVNDPSGRLQIYWADYSTNSPFLTGTTTSHKDGNWHHLAWVRDGNVHTLYLDGGAQASMTTGVSFGTGGRPITIGSSLTFSNRSYLGYIDDLRITKGVARYTAAFTPPAAYTRSGSSLTTAPRKYMASALASPVYTNPGPGFPTELTVTQHRPAFTFRDPIYGGQHHITGTVKEKSTPTNKPLPRRVVLFDERAQLVVRETWSDDGGSYMFYGIRGDIRYTVICYDYTGTYRAVIIDNVIPELI